MASSSSSAKRARVAETPCNNIYVSLERNTDFSTITEEIAPVSAVTYTFDSTKSGTFFHLILRTGVSEAITAEKNGPPLTDLDLELTTRKFYVRPWHVTERPIHSNLLYSFEERYLAILETKIASEEHKLKNLITARDKSKAILARRAPSVPEQEK